MTALAVTADGQRAVTASNDETLKVDLTTGQTLARFQLDSRGQCCAVAPDGVTFIAGDSSGQVPFLRLEPP